MTTTQAAILISQLRAQGLSKSQIANAIGRDSSIISQIEAGKKPGTKYIPALEDLTRGASSVNVERRKTKTGNEARVRGGAIRDERNRVINVVSKSPDGAQTQALLNRIEQNNGLIGIVAMFRYYQAYEMQTPATMDIPLWSNGTSAKWVNDTMRRNGLTFSELITEQVYSAFQPTIAAGVIAVQINAVY